MPPNSEEVEAYKFLEKSVKNIIERYSFKYDVGQLAVVKSIDSTYKRIVVEINGEEKTGSCHPYVGRNISVGDVVTAIYLKNNKDRLRITF